MMNAFPRRSSRIWSGPEQGSRLSSVSAPGLLRYWSEVRPSPWTTALAWADAASIELRTIQPVLRCGFDPLAGERDPGADDEIALHPLPEEMPLVRREPHVGAGPLDDERPVGRVLGGRARPGDVPDVAVAVEESQGFFEVGRNGCRRRGPAAARENRQDDRQGDPGPQQPFG